MSEDLSRYYDPGTLELFQEEKAFWEDIIKDARERIIKDGKYYVDQVKSESNIDGLEPDEVIRDANRLILELRQKCWELYQQDEGTFNKEVFNDLLRNRAQLALLSTTGTNISPELLNEIVVRFMPYFYPLNMSITQSRRSRAGKTFEYLLIDLIRAANYEIEGSQQLGKDFYERHGAKKIVDAIIPNKEAFESDRAHCIILTMKTTLRERWQEVVEEQRRTMIPQIHLATVDTAISGDCATTMGSHNIRLIVPDEVKRGLNNYTNIIGFSEFFQREIPHTLSYWRR